MEIDITIRGAATRERAEFCRRLALFIRQNIPQEVDNHLIIATTDGTDPTTINMEHCGYIGAH